MGGLFKPKKKSLHRGEVATLSYCENVHLFLSEWKTTNLHELIQLRAGSRAKKTFMVE